jgi:BNR repeat-like domain
MKRLGLMVSVLGLFLFVQAAQAEWTPAQRLTWNAGDSFDPVVATGSNGAIHVAWSDSTPGNYEIYYRKSTDGGASWKAIKRLTWTSGDSLEPAIAIDSSNAIHIVWFVEKLVNNATHREVYYKRSTDGGTTWGPVHKLAGTSGTSKYYPAIAIDSANTIHVVWQDDTPVNLEIYYKMSTDGGATWKAAKRLTWTAGNSYVPDIAIDSRDAIHVVWQDYTPGNNEIYYKRSEDGGATWSAAQRLSWTSGYSVSPAVAIDSGGAIHVVWDDITPGNDEVYYKKSEDGGVTWGVAKRLTWSSGNSWCPVIAIDSTDLIYIVWMDDTPGKSEIFCRLSTDRGGTWNVLQRLTWSSISSMYPAIDRDSSDFIHVVWWGEAPGDEGHGEIYYKKGK